MAADCPTVLITGASSGIGAATAERLLQRGWRVVAAARRTDTMQPLAERGAIVEPLDLSEPESRQGLADRLRERFGALDALINNAGFAEVGPLETMSLERARGIFEVNVFGLMGLTQLLLPPMRERGRGRIINISSIAGRWVTPGSGWYGASKFALEALSDALRLELRAFGLEVVVIEPGLIRTPFPDLTATSMRQAQSCAVYGGMMRKVQRSWEAIYRGASSPEEVARTIEQALTQADPPDRYMCGHQWQSVLANRLLPTALWDRLIRMRMT